MNTTRSVRNLFGIFILGLGTLLAFSADTDLDTMDDGYEDFFGLDKNNPGDASLHQDGDLHLNSQEALLWTDPFAGDTDQDGWPDHADTNALSRAVMRWGAEQFTSGDTYDYTGPAWFLGAVKHNGNWLGHSWDVDATETNAASLNIFLDRQILTNSVRMVLTLMDRPGAGLEVDLLNTNGTAAATNVVGNLINGTGVEQWRKVSINLPSVPDGVFISLRRTAGHVTVFETQIYEDDDDDGLDKDQEAQLGTSDALADTDADGFNDRYEDQAGTNPLSASSKPAGLLTLTLPPDTVLSCTDSTSPAATGVATAAAQCTGPLALTYSDSLLTDANTKQLHLKLDDEAGATSAADSSLFHRLATALGGAAMGAPGKSGTAALFDGVDDRISVPYDPALNAASVSFSLWARVDGGQGTYRSALTSRRDAGPNRGYILYAASNNNWEFWTAVGNGSWSVRGGGAVTPGAWTHIACSFDAATGKSAIWVNGVLKSEAAATYVPLSDYSYPLFVGAGGQAGTSFLFRGALDDVAVWNRALTPPDVAALFREGQAGLPAKAASRIDRTWSVADRCGHTTSRTQRIGIADTEAPVLTAPANLDLPCDSGTGTNLAGVATAMDACGTVARVDFADQPEDLAALLKAGFALDEPPVSTNVVDAAGVITGRVFGAGTGDDGRIGRAVRFDGVNDYIDLGTGPSVQGAGDFSVSAWIRTTDADGFAVSQRDGDADGYQGGYYLGVAGGLPMFKLYSWTYAETRTVTGTLAVNDGQWHHLLGVRKGSQAIQIYVDGQLAATAPSFGYVLNGNTSTTLGCNKRDNNNWLAGVVDDVAVYTSALSARAADALHRRGLDGRAAASLRTVTHRTWSAVDEHGNAVTAVQTLVQGDDVGPLLTLPPNTSVFPGEDTSPAAVGVATAVDNCDPAPVIDWVDSDTFASSNLVSHWRFDEAAGAPNAQDDSGVLAAIFFGGAAPGSAGVSGSAVYLDGVDDHLTLGPSAILSSCRSNLTVAAWIKPDRLTGVQRILSGAQAGWGFGLTGNALRFTTFGVKDYNTVAIPALQAGVWTHVAVALDSAATATFYVNGVAVQTIPGTAPANVTATSWRIGGNAIGTERLAGRIDDLAVWNRAITPLELRRHVDLTRLGGTILPAPKNPRLQWIERTWRAKDRSGNAAQAQATPDRKLQTIAMTDLVLRGTDITHDPDGDGLSTKEELEIGTDINNPDTDGDGVPDGVEVRYGCDGSSPLTWNEYSKWELAHMMGLPGVEVSVDATFIQDDPEVAQNQSSSVSGLRSTGLQATPGADCGVGTTSASLSPTGQYTSLASLGDGALRLYVDHAAGATEDERYGASAQVEVGVKGGHVVEGPTPAFYHDASGTAGLTDTGFSATLHFGYVEDITDRTAGGFAHIDFKVEPDIPRIVLTPSSKQVKVGSQPIEYVASLEGMETTESPVELWWEISPNLPDGARIQLNHDELGCALKTTRTTIQVVPGLATGNYVITAKPRGISTCQGVNLAGTATLDVKVDTINMAIVPIGAEAYPDLPTPVEIAAGGIASAAHQASVSIQIQPAVEGVPVQLQMENGMGKFKHATLQLENGGLVVGDTPLIVQTGPGGLISGTLTSSDTLTVCTIKAQTQDVGPEAEVAVKFGWIWEEGFDSETEWVMDPETLYDLGPDGVWTNQVRFLHHRAPSAAAPSVPLDGHEIRYYVHELVYAGADGELQTITDSPEAPSEEMSNWAEYRQASVTDGNGSALGELEVFRREGVVSLKLRAYDLTVIVPAPLPEPTAPELQTMLQSEGAVEPPTGQPPGPPSDPGQSHKYVEKAPNIFPLMLCLAAPDGEFPLASEVTFPGMGNKSMGVRVVYFVTPKSGENPWNERITVEYFDGQSWVDAVIADKCAMSKQKDGANVAGHGSFITGPAAGDHYSGLREYWIYPKSDGEYRIRGWLDDLPYDLAAFTAKDASPRFTTAIGASQPLEVSTTTGAEKAHLFPLSTQVLGENGAVTFEPVKVLLDSGSSSDKFKHTSSPYGALSAEILGDGENIRIQALTEGEFDLRAMYSRPVKYGIINIYARSDGKTLDMVPKESQEVSGYGEIKPLKLICPDMKIKSPSEEHPADGVEGSGGLVYYVGEPDATGVVDEKLMTTDKEENLPPPPENNALFVFDIGSGAEDAGMCFVECVAAELEMLSPETRELVWQLIEWELPDVGSVSPSWTWREGAMTQFSYLSMPESNDDFGNKTLTLRFSGSSVWSYSHPVQFRYARWGTTASSQHPVANRISGGEPNWYVYWQQAVAKFVHPESKEFSASASKLIYKMHPQEEGEDDEERKESGQYISQRTSIADDQITMYESTGRGILPFAITLHHENGHRQSRLLENSKGGFGDPFVWSGDNDSDRDGIHDEWERGDYANSLGFTVSNLAIKEGQDKAVYDSKLRGDAWEHGWSTLDEFNANKQGTYIRPYKDGGYDINTGRGLCVRNEQHVLKEAGNIQKLDWSRCVKP